MAGRAIPVGLLAPILAYLIETANGWILYDVGCDYSKIHDPILRERYYDKAVFHGLRTAGSRANFAHGLRVHQRRSGR